MEKRKMIDNSGSARPSGVPGSTRLYYKKIRICLVLFTFLHSSALHAQIRSLDYFIEQALSNSPLLKDYNNQVFSNRIDSALIRAAYKPQVTGTGNNYYAPIIKGWGYDEAITNGANISALVGVNKALVGNKNLQAQFEAIRLNIQGIENTASLSEQDLKRTITGQYITTFGDWQQLNFITEVYSLLQKEDTILKKLTENNVYKQTDYLTFLVTLQQQKLALKQANIQLRNDYATLAYLCGIYDTTVINLQEPSLTIRQLPDPEYSVFFKQYLIDSLQHVNERAMIDFSYKPKVNVFADAGYNSSLAYLPYKNFGTSFGFGITVPICDGKQRQMKYSKIAIAERTRQSYKSFFTRQYEQQIAQLFDQLKGTEELIDEINSQVKYSEGLIHAHIQLLTTGDVRVADLVIAFNNYLTAKNLLTQNNISRWQIINQINYWAR